MVSLSDFGHPHNSTRRVRVRHFEILGCENIPGWRESSNYSYPVLLKMRFHWNGLNAEVIDIGFTAEQLLDYRLMQISIFKQRSVLIIDEEFELGDVGLWPLRLAYHLGGGN